MPWNVVIAGGGFGGFYAARTLEKVLVPGAAKVTLVNDVNFMLYTPLLPGAAAGTLEPGTSWCRCASSSSPPSCAGHGHGRRPGAQRPARRVARRPHGRPALRPPRRGARLGLQDAPIPGLKEHAIGFKALPEAIELRNRVIRTLELAETMEDPAERESWLTYVFVGAGYAGLEGLAELQDFAKDVIELYPRCRAHGMRWILVEAKERVMTEIEPTWRLRLPGAARARHRDPDEHDARPGHRLRGAPLGRRGRPHAHRRLDHGGQAASRGRQPRPAHGRRRPIVTERTLRVQGRRDVWAIGDNASVPDPAKDYKANCPPTAQHAIRQGPARGPQHLRGARHGTVRPFTYKTKGVFVDLGQGDASPPRWGSSGGVVPHGSSRAPTTWR
jgi:NADH dehydrogenase